MHIRVLSTDDYINRVKPFIEKVGLNFDEDKFRIVAKDIQERTKIWVKIINLIQLNI